MRALVFPPDTKFPLPAGAYYRNAAGEFVLSCDSVQLAAALEVADAIADSQHRPPAGATPTDAVLRRYNAFGDPWLLRTNPPGESSETENV